MASEASYEQTLVTFPVLLSPDFSLLSKMRSLHGGSLRKQEFNSRATHRHWSNTFFLIHGLFGGQHLPKWLIFFTLHDRSIDRNVNTALAKAWKFVLNSSLYLRTHFHSYKYIAEIEYEMKTHQSRGINTDQNFKIDQKKKKDSIMT